MAKTLKKLNNIKLKQSAYKLTSAVVLTVAAFASFYNLFEDHLANTPNWVAKFLAAVVTVSFVVVLAACEEK